MPGGFTGGIEKGLKLAIPLAMKSMDLDMEKAKLEIATQQHQENLLQKAQKLKLDTEVEKNKIKTNQLTVLMAARKEAGLHNNENLVNQINQQIMEIDPVIGDELALLPTETYEEQLVREAGELGEKKEAEKKAEAKYRKPEKDPAKIAFYNKAVAQGYTGTIVELEKEIKKAGRTQINIGDIIAKQDAKAIAKMKTDIRAPKFKADAIKIVKDRYDIIDWDDLPEKDKKLEIRKVMDENIRIIYGDEEVVFDNIEGKVGWYTTDGELIRLAD